jgi:hypothetical protein
MSFFIQVREQGAKKGKKMDFAKTKSGIYKQQGFLLKFRWVTFFTSVIQFKKKNFDFGQK